MGFGAAQAGEVRFTSVIDAGIGVSDDLDISPGGDRLVYFHCNRRNCTDRSLRVVTASGREIAVDRSRRAKRWKDPHFVGEDAIVVFERGFLNHASGKSVLLRIAPGGRLERAAEGPMPRYNNVHASILGREVVIAAADPGGHRIAIVGLDGRVVKALTGFEHMYAPWLRAAPDRLWFRAFVGASDEAFLRGYDGPATILTTSSRLPISGGGFEVRGFVEFGPERQASQQAVAAMMREVMLLPAGFQRPAPGHLPDSWVEFWDVSESGKLLATTAHGMHLIDPDRLTAPVVLKAADFDRAGVRLSRALSFALSDSGRVAMLRQDGSVGARRIVSVSDPLN